MNSIDKRLARLQAKPRRERNKKEDKKAKKWKLKADDPLCSICRHEFKCPKDVHYDHNHKTGEYRGLLCTKCNVGLGLFRDNIDVLQSAVDYLNYWNNKKINEAKLLIEQTLKMFNRQDGIFDAIKYEPKQ
jgi:hypothetical protein